MKSKWRLIRVALSSISLSLILLTISAHADEDIRAWTESRVQTGLVRPLAQKESERSRFSRALPAPRERRVVVSSSAVFKDKRGAEFVNYEIEVRYSDSWEREYVGCVYRRSGDIFVMLGETYRPSAFLLGKKVASESGVCIAAPQKRS